MKLKQLALAATTAASVLVGCTVAAQAQPSKCAFRTPTDFMTFNCDRSHRTNANGHTVTEIVYFNEGVRQQWSILFWTENGLPDYAEVWHAGDRIVTDAYRAKNGSWCIDNNNTQFCFD